MKFTKMQGAGNDYVYMDITGGRPDVDMARLAIEISDRHFGVGADGLILICPSDKADFRMEMYNADGSLGRMCGNGIRCVGKYVYDRRLTDKTELTIETLAGLRHLKIEAENGVAQKIRVDMGEPILEPDRIPAAFPGERAIRVPLILEDRGMEISCVSMGNPHAVLFVEDVANYPVEKTGPIIENHPAFPERINAEFVQIVSPNHLKMRVWERGSGETMACGTGACASLVAAVLCGKAERRATLELLGGDLEIEWDEKSGSVWMTGPAAFVFDGEYFTEVQK